jgi:hypothetical protein
MASQPAGAVIAAFLRIFENWRFTLCGISLKDICRANLNA